MRRLKTNVTAMTGVVLASLAIATPATADCGAGAIQEATYVDGVWAGLNGALVDAIQAPEGLAWRVVEGATLEVGVVVETFAEPGSNIGSALWMVPAADKGIAPLFDGADQRVIFTGSVPCDAEPELDVHEDPIEAFEQPDEADEPPAQDRAPEPAPSVETRRSTVVESEVVASPARSAPPTWSWRWHRPI